EKVQITLVDRVDVKAVVIHDLQLNNLPRLQTGKIKTVLIKTVGIAVLSRISARSFAGGRTMERNAITDGLGGGGNGVVRVGRKSIVNRGVYGGTGNR